MTYSEKLKDPRWQRKRLEVFNRDGFKCTVCECETKTLHVHHRIYIKGRDPWDYPDELLVTFCEDCHASEEEAKQEALMAIYEGFAKKGFSNSDIIFIAKNMENLPFVPWVPPIYSQIIHVIENAELRNEIARLIDKSYNEYIRTLEGSF